MFLYVAADLAGIAAVIATSAAVGLVCVNEAHATALATLLANRLLAPNCSGYPRSANNGGQNGRLRATESFANSEVVAAAG